MRGVNIARIKMFGVQPQKYIPLYVARCCVVSAGYLCVKVNTTIAVLNVMKSCTTQAELSSCHLLNMRENFQLSGLHISSELAYNIYFFSSKSL